MASENRPGVEISQEAETTTTVSVSADLVPNVVGPCYQIIETQDSEGALNSEAEFSGDLYNQASMLIPQASLPDPRSNIDELVIDNASLEASLSFGGALSALVRGSHDSVGTAFLDTANLAHRAAFRTSEHTSFTFDAVTGDVWVVAPNVVNPVDTSKDVTISFLGVMTAQEVVDAINSAMGSDVASIYDDAGDQYVQLTSLSNGANSSWTIRPGTSALPILFGAGFDAAKTYRVEGAGFRGQDDLDSDLTTPWIEFHQGLYSEDDVDTTFPAGTPTSPGVWAFLLDEDDTVVQTKAPAVTFSGASPTFELKAASSSRPGDLYYADGVRVGSGEIIKLEPSRFKIGALNVQNSTFDSDGVAVDRIYDTVEVNTPIAGSAFAPRYGYFVANGLEFGAAEINGVAATLDGSLTGLDARPAIVQSSADITFPLSAAGLTIIYQLTEDDVQADEVTHIIAGGPFAAIGDLVTNLAAVFDGVTVSNLGDRLMLTTDKTGTGQTISIKPSGTANTSLNFSAVIATEDSGKDVEFAGLASAAGGVISLPLVGESSVSLALSVVDAKGTHTLSATGIDLSAAATMDDLRDAVATAFGGGPADANLYDGGIAVATVSVTNGATASGVMTLASIEGGSAVSIALTAVDMDDGFTACGFWDPTNGKPAELTSPVLSLPDAALATKVLTISYDDGAGPYGQTTGALAAGAGTAATPSDLAALLNAIVGFTDETSDRVIWAIGDDTAGTLLFRSTGRASADSMDLDAGAGTAGLQLGFTEGSDDTDTGTALVDNTDIDGTNGLLGSLLQFTLDENVFVYEVSFSTNSLDDAIDEVNTTVGGAQDVASETSKAMTLTSLLEGAASEVEIVSSTGATVLGLSGADGGTGRPNPNFYVDGTGNVNIGPSILRNGATGLPYSLESAFATVYLAYTALRLDVSSAALSPGLLSFEDTTVLEQAIGPISTSNPLALGVFLAKANAPDVDVTALGLDEVNDAAPEGTVDSWVRALEFLAAKEVYAIAPLTGDKFVNSLIATHVQTISLPKNRGERICLIWQDAPTEADDAVVSSGTDAFANGTDGSITLETNTEPDLIQAGLDPSGTIPVDDGLFIELLIIAGGTSELRRYSISFVNGVVLTLRTTFATGENDDGFYSVEPFLGSSGLTGQDWSMQVRGEPLYITGTSSLDYSLVASTAAAQAASYLHKRVTFLYAPSVLTSIDGLEQTVPGYYAAAAIAGMVASLPPDQPFTNLPIAGISSVAGTDDTFSPPQLDTISDGGRYLLVNQGSNVAAWAARTTMTTILEERELSIVKAIDWFAKTLRGGNRAFTGRNNITPGFLDQLVMLNQGMCEYAGPDGVGVFNSASLQNLLQDESAPDTVLVETEVDVKYPCNKIKITILS